MQMGYNRPMPEGNLPLSERDLPRPARLRHTVFEVLRLVIVAAAIAFPIRYFIAQPFIVRGASMEPNFADGQYLIINELSYYLRPPARGEVVVFHYPLDPHEYFIKRVIGLPGEGVEVDGTSVTITNAEYPTGFTLSEPYLPAGRASLHRRSFTLGPDQYVVLGDNRPASSDSTSWGALERRFITGYVILRAWPPSVADLIRQPSY